jgi:hypothetical protein
MHKPKRKSSQAQPKTAFSKNAKKMPLQRWHPPPQAVKLRPPRKNWQAQPKTASQRNASRIQLAADVLDQVIFSRLLRQAQQRRLGVPHQQLVAGQV